MITQLLNLTKKQLNPDQEECLKYYGITSWSKPRSIFLKCGSDLVKIASNRAVIITAPWEIVAEAMSDGLTAKLISWQSDSGYRKRKMFVLASMKVYTLDNGSIISKEEIPWSAKWGNDFKTGGLIVLDKAIT